MPSPLDARRYLIPFRSLLLPHIVTDTLVIGSGVAGLRAFIMSRRPQFAEAIIQKLLAYALGRDIEYFDRPAVRHIVREAAANDYRWSAIVEAIVKSVPFQMSVVKEQPAN